MQKVQKFSVAADSRMPRSRAQLLRVCGLHGQFTALADGERAQDVLAEIGDVQDREERVRDDLVRVGGVLGVWDLSFPNGVICPCEYAVRVDRLANRPVGGVELECRCTLTEVWCDEILTSPPLQQELTICHSDDVATGEESGVRSRDAIRG